MCVLAIRKLHWKAYKTSFWLNKRYRERDERMCIWVELKCKLVSCIIDMLILIVHIYFETWTWNVTLIEFYQNDSHTHEMTRTLIFFTHSQDIFHIDREIFLLLLLMAFQNEVLHAYQKLTAEHMLCRQSFNIWGNCSSDVGAEVHVSHHEMFNVQCSYTYYIHIVQHILHFVCHSTFNILSKALSNRSLQLQTQEYGLFLIRWSVKCSCILSFVKSINDSKS